MLKESELAPRKHSGHGFTIRKSSTIKKVDDRSAFEPYQSFQYDRAAKANSSKRAVEEDSTGSSMQLGMSTADNYTQHMHS